MSTPAMAPEKIERSEIQRVPDVYMIAGIVVAIASVIAGIAATGVGLTYFLQPTGMLIVVGGTAGVTLATTPRRAMRDSAGAVVRLLFATRFDRVALIEEIISLARPVRSRGVLALEPMISSISNPFLRESLALAVDVPDRAQLKAALETRLRVRERHGDADAKMLEVAGGFAPTIGVLGTVVGLIDVLRQFSNISGVAGGVGTAFVSTIYGLGLANLILLPAAHRIRANVAEMFEIDEMIVEGVVSLIDGLHPSLLRERLSAFVERVD